NTVEAKLRGKGAVAEERTRFFPATSPPNDFFVPDNAMDCSVTLIGERGKVSGSDEVTTALEKACKNENIPVPDVQIEVPIASDGPAKAYKLTFAFWPRTVG